MLPEFLFKEKAEGEVDLQHDGVIVVCILRGPCCWNDII